METKYYTDIHVLNWRIMTVFAGIKYSKELEKEHFVVKDNENVGN